MTKEIEDKLRLFRLDVLSVLHSLSSTDSIALKLDELSELTGTMETELKGIVSTLRRTKVEEQSLIQPAGRDANGRLRWQINETAVKKNELSKFLEEEILGKEGLTIAR